MVDKERATEQGNRATEQVQKHLAKNQKIRELSFFIVNFKSEKVKGFKLCLFTFDLCNICFYSQKTKLINIVHSRRNAFGRTYELGIS